MKKQKQKTEKQNIENQNVTKSRVTSQIVIQKNRKKVELINKKRITEKNRSLPYRKNQD